METHLQLLTEETLRYHIAKNEDEARSDISTWGSRFKNVFIDVLVFNPNSASYQHLDSEPCFSRQEQEKWHQSKRFNMPLSPHLSSPQLVGWASLPLLSILRDLHTPVSEERRVVQQRHLSAPHLHGFALLRSSITCQRGFRSISINNDCPSSISQCVMNGCIPPIYTSH